MSVQPPGEIFDPYGRLASLGLSLHTRTFRAPWFEGARRSGDLLFTSGQPALDERGEPVVRGRLGAEVGIEDGARAARQAMLNTLCIVHQVTGDLRQWRPFKISIGLATTPEFTAIGEVNNGASLLLVEVFGPHLGKHLRTGHSMVSPPGGSPVEVEAIFERR
ncbi:MAG TPA: RidA family protein [Micromonospora sp.]